MKAKRITVVFVLAMVVILVSAVPAAAKATRIYYEGTICPMEVGSPVRQWVSDDGILHQRGMPSYNILTSESPYFAGTATIVMNTEINLKTGEVHSYGTVSIRPDAYIGTWEGHYSTHVSADGILRGSSTGQGTGELAGMKIFNDMSSAVPDPACNMINTINSGSVLIP